MKKRVGFVSNSSASSFICEVCGNSVVSWDGCPEGWKYCENEHLICEEDIEGSEEIDGCIVEAACPICQFLEVSHSDMGHYLEKESGIKRTEILEEIKKINKRRKKLYDNEYTEAVCRRLGTTVQETLQKVKERFGTYTNFMNYYNT